MTNTTPSQPLKETKTRLARNSTQRRWEEETRPYSDNVGRKKIRNSSDANVMRTRGPPSALRLKFGIHQTLQVAYFLQSQQLPATETHSKVLLNRQDNVHV